MKARRFFAFVAGAAMLFGVGCTPDQKEGNKGDESMAEITVTPSSFATDLDGGEQVITVTSNATWSVTCNQEDVTIEPLTGTGNGSVTITVRAAAAREFNVVFDAQKQTLIPALGTSTTTTAKAEVTVSQNEGGVNLDDYLYYEKVGDDVEKDGNYWPYVDKFLGWTPEGEAAANVTYKGNNASVRASGNAYEPTEDAVGVSGQPYVFLNKVPASAYFVIENIAVTGGSNYIFTFNVQCQIGYSGSPTFAEVDNALVHLELGYDGQNWDAVDCTFAPNGGNGWYAASVEFKVKADATALYARFTYEAPASNGGGRFDDFKLVAGGNGAELTPSAPVVPEQPEKPEGAVSIPYSEPFATSQGYFTINDVVLGEGLTYVWKHESGQYGAYMKASAYKDGAAKASESWLISPEITLAGATAPAVSFEHCHKFAGTPSEELTLWISENAGASWAQLTIPAYGTNSDYNFVANSIDLTAYVGKTVQIAFKYVATSTHAGTWEVKNFKVAENDGSTTEPEQPGQGGNDDTGAEATGVFTSSAAFVCSDDDSTNKSYSLKDSKINGAACSGVKLGTGSNAGVFTSAAVGVEGTKTLGFYGMAWKGKTATLYIKVEGSDDVKQVSLNANDGATGNPPFTITVTDADYYSVELTGLTADSKILFSTDATFTAAENTTSGRAVLAGIQFVDGTSSTPETPEQPGQGEGGETPETPETPENPEPEQPGQGEGGETPAPENPEQPETPENPEPEQPGQGGGEASGVFTSSAAFVCSADDSTNKYYTLGESTINGSACSGFKLGTGSNAGVFTSAAVGVEGTKTIGFYGMAWKGKTATIYIKVEGSNDVKSVALTANVGATGNPPYTITVTDADYNSVVLTGLTADSKIMFSTDATFSTASSSAPRAVLAGITLK